MIVLQLTSCPAGVRGDVTKWLMEISTGVYVGQLSQRAREELWKRICKHAGDGSAVMVCSARNEQGFVYYVHNSAWQPSDFDGIILMRRPLPLQRPPDKKEDFPQKQKQEKIERTGVESSGGIGRVEDAPPQIAERVPSDPDCQEPAQYPTAKQHVPDDKGNISAKKEAAEFPKQKPRRSLPLPYLPWPENAPLPDSFTVLDVETTGLKPETCQMIEAACVRVRKGKIVEEWSSLIRVEEALPEMIQNLTGITDELLANEGRLLEEVVPTLLSFIGDDCLLGHNIAFDIRFLLSACEKLRLAPPPVHAIDTVLLSRSQLADEVPNFRLETVAAHLGIPDKQTHRALPDARMTAKLFFKLNKKTNEAN